MAKIAFWITAGPELQDKALANIVLASRLKKNRSQDVQVYFFGPGVKLAGHADGKLLDALGALGESIVPMGACGANAEQYGVTQSLTEKGIVIEPAGEALIRLIDQGYEVVGV